MKTSIRSTSKSLVLGMTLLALTTPSLACFHNPVLPRLSAHPGANQQLLYEDGAEKLISLQDGSIVSIRMAEPMSGHTTFVIGVANQSPGPIVIGPEMVTVNQMGRNLRVLPYEEVESLERKKAESARMQQTLMGVLSTVSSMSGVPTGHLSAFQTQLQTTQKTLMTVVQNNSSKEAATAELNLKELSQVALKKNTLFPQQNGGGVIYAEKQGPGPIAVRVQIGRDAHDFQFSL